MLVVVKRHLIVVAQSDGGIKQRKKFSVAAENYSGSYRRNNLVVCAKSYGGSNRRDLDVIKMSGGDSNRRKRFNCSCDE